MTRYVRAASEIIPPYGSIFFSCWSWVRLGLCATPGLWTDLTQHICKCQAQRMLCSEEPWEILPRGWRFKGLLVPQAMICPSPSCLLSTELSGAQLTPISQAAHK